MLQVAVCGGAEPRPVRRGRTGAAAPSPAEHPILSEVAPWIVERCLRCHGDDGPRANLRLTRRDGWEKGGDNGPLIEAKSPDSSLLVRKLRGTADGERMPLGGPPVNDAELTPLVRWIEQGASWEGVPSDLSLREWVNARRLEKASEEELNQERHHAAKDHWSRAFPRSPFESVETAHFLVVGSGGRERLTEWGTTAETMWSTWTRSLPGASRAATSRGRMTLFVVPRPYDLHEFALMVENRSLAAPLDTEFWSAPGTDAYVVIQVTDGTKPKQQPWARGIAGLSLRRAGGCPPWFERGLADAFAARVTPELPRIRRLNGVMGQLTQALQQANDFQTGKTSLELTDAASLSFIQFLMKDRPRWARLLLALDQPDAFSDHLEQTYGVTTDELLLRWWQGLGGRAGGRSSTDTATPRGRK